MAAQLRAERAAQNLTYKELAERADLKEQSVMRYLTEKRDFGASELGAMADALGISPYELMRRAVERIEE